MGHSHHHGTCSHEPLNDAHARVLKIVFVLNAGMAVIEGVTGYIIHSKALMADTLDMAGDALTAGSSVLVQKKSQRAQAWVALGKAALMMAMGIGVLVTAGMAIFNPVMPVMAAMGVVAAMALAVNTISFALLYRFRNDNINMKSTMLCMRNDMISNVAVLGAAAVGALLLSPVPDIVVGVAISGLFLKTSYDITREALAILRPAKKADEKGADVAPKVKKPARENILNLKKVIGSLFNHKAKPSAPVAAVKQVSSQLINKEI